MIRISYFTLIDLVTKMRITAIPMVAVAELIIAPLIFFQASTPLIRAMSAKASKLKKTLIKVYIEVDADAHQVQGLNVCMIYLLLVLATDVPPLI